MSGINKYVTFFYLPHNKEIFERFVLIKMLKLEWQTTHTVINYSKHPPFAFSVFISDRVSSIPHCPIFHICTSLYCTPSLTRNPNFKLQCLKLRYAQDFETCNIHSVLISIKKFGELVLFQFVKFIKKREEKKIIWFIRQCLIFVFKVCRGS